MLYAMIIHNAISAKTAESAWKNHERQLAIRHAAELELALATRPNDRPFVILSDTKEVSAACDQFAKVRTLQRRVQHYHR